MARRYDEDKIPQVYSREDIPAFETRDGATFQRFRSVHKSVGLVTAEPGGQTYRHKHPWEQIVFVLSGETDFDVGGEIITVEEGDLFFIPPNVMHELRPTDEVCKLFVVWPYSEEHDQHYEYQEEFYQEE